MKMNSLQLHNLKKNINRVISKLNQKYGDAEYNLDGIFDYIDSSLNYQENMEILLEEIANRGFDDPFFRQEKLEQQQRDKLKVIEENLFLFKRKLFSIRGRLSKLTSLHSYYERGYKKLLRSKELIDDPRNSIYIKKQDLFSYYQKEQRKQRMLKTSLIAPIGERVDI